MLTILDVSNFWSDAADDARCYHAAKLEFMRERTDLRYVVVRADVGTWTECLGSARIEHVESSPSAGSRSGLGAGGAGAPMMLSGRRLRDLVQLHRPDVIECGSALVLPILVQLAAARLNPRPALIGHWHGDLARELVEPKLASIDPRLAHAGSRAAQWWARSGYASFDAVFVASPMDAHTLVARGLDRVYLTPLGVDLEQFAARRRSPEQVEQLRAGVASRPIFWADGDPSELGPIYAELCRRSSHDPALVLGGRGPEHELDRERMAGARAHVHALEFAMPSTPSTAAARARALASCDVALMSTGAASCLEAMACERVVVAHDGGLGRGRRAAELVRESGCGRTLATASGPAAVATALLEQFAALERGDAGGIGRRGRAWAIGYDWTSCLERIVVCTREVLGHVRAGRRVPAGVHERMRPAALAASG